MTDSLIEEIYLVAARTYHMARCRQFTSFRLD
jgi:hypothetical protein